jgi:hypothetical protein
MIAPTAQASRQRPDSTRCAAIRVVVVQAGLALLLFGCQSESPAPPIPVSGPNLGDPQLQTVELWVDEASRNPNELRQSPSSRFNVAWWGVVQPEFPDHEPQPYFVKIGQRRRTDPRSKNLVFVESASVMAILAVEFEPARSRYRVEMTAPVAPGNYILQLFLQQDPLLELPLVVE